MKKYIVEPNGIFYDVYQKDESGEDIVSSVGSYSESNPDLVCDCDSDSKECAHIKAVRRYLEKKAKPSPNYL